MNEPIDLHEFAQHVRHALAALYDYPRLQALPLAQLLVGDKPESARGPALHRLLLQAIEDLRPPSLSASTPAVRRYQYLYLRYVDVRTIGDVAAMLGVSLRQARRDHHDALDVIASRLYEAYRAGSAEPDSSTAVPAESTLATEAGRIGMRPGQTRCDEVIASTIETLRPLGVARGVTFRQALSSSPGSTSIDRALVRQILINAVGHSVELLRDGEIAITSQSSADHTELSVQIPNVAIGHGSIDDGPRLAVCRHLLSLVQGSLRLERNGTGVHLVITLPGVAPATVLVVDDNPDVRQLFRRYLAGSPYRVVEATSFDDALEAVRTIHPDVVSIDVMLPERDGWELLQRLKQDAECATVPVIVCSVLRERDLAFALGAADFLEKPVTQQALLAAIEKQVARWTPTTVRGSAAGARASRAP